MKNELKNNPLACGLLGVIIGSGGTFAGQTLLNTFDSSSNQTYAVSAVKSKNNFDIVPYDEFGDVVITPHGTKYHSEYCYTLNKAKMIQRVSSDDAIAAGLEPCSRCQ